MTLRAETGPRLDGGGSGPLLAVDELTVHYDRITALNRLSLHVNPGEVVAIVGPNGAGKSSLLGAVAGVARAASGEINSAARRSWANRWSGQCAAASHWCRKVATSSRD